MQARTTYKSFFDTEPNLRGTELIRNLALAVFESRMLGTTLNSLRSLVARDLVRAMGIDSRTLLEHLTLPAEPLDDIEFCRTVRCTPLQFAEVFTSNELAALRLIAATHRRLGPSIFAGDSTGWARTQFSPGQVLAWVNHWAEHSGQPGLLAMGLEPRLVAERRLPDTEPSLAVTESDQGDLGGNGEYVVTFLGESVVLASKWPREG